MSSASLVKSVACTSAAHLHKSKKSTDASFTSSLSVLERRREGGETEREGKGGRGERGEGRGEREEGDTTVVRSKVDVDYVLEITIPIWNEM